MKIFKRIVLITLIGGMMMSLFGCSTKKYHVDYCGSKKLYNGAKDYYKAGEVVVLKYDLIATDTDYSFYLDGEILNCEYQDGSFIIGFTMPDHDVKLEMSAKNTMVYIPSINIKLINQVAPADIWILKNSEENRKTTVWGYADLYKGEYALNEEITVNLNEEESYIIRMIDESKYYYSVDNITLKKGDKLIIKEGEYPMSAIAEIVDENDQVISEYEMFVARL